ncbi:MAG: STAS domain-containing protein [Nitrospira sp.]|nr:STAS domain-containing protein [Nitrospira sp.]MBX3350552.1 STAS domain-containing protein [Nitrospira sp.]
MMTDASGTNTPQAEAANSRHLAPTGDLSIFEAGEFKEALVKLMANEGLVSLDLSNVDRVDTAAIQLMLSARKQARMLVMGIPQDLQDKLKQLGFTGELSE